MTLELRGSARPTLQQALRWIGSRVDDIYGASVGKLEDIWMDPDSGEPLWLLVRDGRIGGRHTLVPFAQAASGAGHVWIPFEREVVRGAPAVRPSAPLSHELSDTLRRYYAESGHPVAENVRAEEALREAAPAEAEHEAEPMRAPEPPRMPEPASRATSQTGAIPAAAQRRPAPPPAAPPPRRQQSPNHNHAPAEPAPLPPLPPRTPPRRHQHQAPRQEGFAAPRPQEPWTPPRRPAPPPEPPREPSRSDRTAPPRQEQPAPAPVGAPEELRLAVGESVDMELVGRFQFRGNIVRLRPLAEGADPPR